jgi:hypothetical protein
MLCRHGSFPQNCRDRAMLAIASFIIHYLGLASQQQVLWGHLSEMLVYRASEATTFVNTCRLPITNRTLMLSPISTYDNRSARPSDSGSHGWHRLDHPGNAGHPLVRLQPVCMLICIGHNDRFVGASITCHLL